VVTNDIKSETLSLLSPEAPDCSEVFVDEELPLELELEPPQAASTSAISDATKTAIATLALVDFSLRIELFPILVEGFD
jgi:hypothetical protein